MRINELISKYAFDKLKRNNFNIVYKIKSPSSLLTIVADLIGMVELGMIPFHEFDIEKDSYFFRYTNNDYIFFCKDESIISSIRLCLTENCSIEKIDIS